MIRIELDDRALGQTRIALSPLWEVGTSLCLLDRRRHQQPPWPYTRWAEQARRVLATDPRTAPLRLAEDAGFGGYPDCLEPPPRGVETLAAELARVRATPPGLMRAQLARHFPDRLPDWARPYHDDPPAALGRWADAVEAYWEQAIAPYWPAMRTVLEEEVLLRARALATDGPDALLATLHPRVRWERPALTLDKWHVEASYASGERGLVLVPLVF